MKRLTIAAIALVCALALGACGDASALSDSDSDSPSGAARDRAIVVGSQDYYSNEIIAEVYAQADRKAHV